MNPYESVAEFERRMAVFAGAREGVATDSCTSALFLACKFLGVKKVTLPARTYISVPAAVVHAGGSVAFEDVQWTGMYALKPYPIYDAALRLRHGMFEGGFQCLSFQSKKHLPIGRGGMLLTDDSDAARWLRQARSNGRHFNVPFTEDRIDMLGWNFYMTPEQGDKGLQLLQDLRPDLPDIVNEYPDLREMPVFKEAA